jgi:hypothetical protein
MEVKDFDDATDAAWSERVAVLTARLAEVERELGQYAEAYAQALGRLDNARARTQDAEARAYTLAVAIMGGEDAPGYADSIHADDLAAQLRKERASRDEWTDACVKAALATAREDAVAAVRRALYATRDLTWSGVEALISDHAAILALIDKEEKK